MNATETTPVQAPEWLADIEFCHLMPEDSAVTRCGKRATDLPGRSNHLTDWKASICPNCGRPRCPRCAQLRALEDALEDA